MSFRRRLLVLFSLAVLVPITAVTVIVSTLARRAFDRSNDEQTSALVSQFQREFERRGEELGRRLQSTAELPEVTRMAVASAQAAPDYGPFLDTGQVLARAGRLDFLEVVDERGTIISSAHWPAKVGFREPLVASTIPAQPFLKEEELASGPELGLFAARSIAIEGRRIYLIGGTRLNQSFLSSLAVPAGTRVMLYENLPGQSFSPSRLISATGQAEDSLQLRELIERVTSQGSQAQAVIHWSWGDEAVTGSALHGASQEVLGALIIANSRRIYLELRGQIRSAALLALAVGIALAIVASSWAAARVTRPVEDLAQAARQVAGGDWTTSVEIRSRDEIGQLAEAFNRMTAQLVSQQDRLVQAERVAAWRDVARRLAHELKNPLFPLQLTVENLLRAREQSDQLFDEAFRESAATLLSEIQRLKTIVARFSDFSKMPQPQPESLDVAELARSVGKLHQAQLANVHIAFAVEAENVRPILADPELIRRALSNLVLNAIEAMPQGGRLTIRIRQQPGGVEIAVADTGAGLTPEARARIFTPYYTTKSAGTGLGLAIVQSIVSDHRGRISVRSEPGQGTAFIIELPDELSRTRSAEGTHG